MSGKGMWTGARGLADDVRYYGQWMRDRASSGLAIFIQRFNCRRRARQDRHCLALGADSHVSESRLWGADAPDKSDSPFRRKLAQKSVVGTQWWTIPPAVYTLKSRRAIGKAPEGT